MFGVEWVFFCTYWGYSSFSFASSSESEKSTYNVLGADPYAGGMVFCFPFRKVPLSGSMVLSRYMVPIPSLVTF